MDILQAVKQLRPGTNWNLRGDSLEQAEDGTPRVSPPSMAEIQVVLQSQAYIDKRVKEYPSMGDQLDALWKGGDALNAMKKQIDAVKAKYPKSE